jgi:stage III sporulation protein AB
VLKIAGTILIILSTTGIGILSGRDLKLRLEELRYIKKIMLMLRGEIQYLKAPLGEAFFHVGARAKAPFDTFLNKIAQDIERLECESFYKIWCKYIDEELSHINLNKRDCMMLKRVGEHLGYMDRDLQMGMLDLYLEQLEEEINLSKEKMEDKIKIYNCLGISAGIFAVLLML